MRRAWAGADQRTSRNAEIEAGSEENAASTGNVFRSRIVWPGAARAKKLASEKEDLRATVVCVPAVGSTATPFSTKTTSMGTWSRRFKTSDCNATFDAADFTKRRFFWSRKSFMPLDRAAGVKSGGLPSVYWSGAEGSHRGGPEFF